MLLPACRVFLSGHTVPGMVLCSQPSQAASAQILTQKSEKSNKISHSGGSCRSVYPYTDEIGLYFYSVEISDILYLNYLEIKPNTKQIWFLMTVQLCASHMRNLAFCCVKQFRF